MNLPTGTYDIVLADPPVKYYGSPTKWGACEKFYTTMTDQEILDFPMRSLMNPKSILFLWATCPRLDFAVKCIENWGLHYRGVAFVWVKTKLNGEPIGAQGVRPSIVKPLTELVLCASTVKTGRPLKLADESIPQTVFLPKSEHSRKPDVVQERIEKMYPTATKIELFARRYRFDWDAFGDQLPEEKVA